MATVVMAASAVTRSADHVSSETDNNFHSDTLKLTEGRHLKPDDKNKAVIHEDLAKANNLSVGSKLTLKGNKYVVDNER